jgi:hypothetical protein
MPERIETLKYKSVSKRERRKKEIRPEIYNRIMTVISVA